MITFEFLARAFDNFAVSNNRSQKATNLRSLPDARQGSFFVSKCKLDARLSEFFWHARVLERSGYDLFFNHEKHERHESFPILSFVYFVSFVVGSSENLVAS